MFYLMVKAAITFTDVIGEAKAHGNITFENLMRLVSKG